MTTGVTSEPSVPLPGQRRLRIRADAKIVKIRSTDLLRILRAVSLAASSDEDRPRLRAVHFDVSDELVVTATDGHWLAQWRCEPEELTSVPAAMLVSLTDVQRLIPLLAADAKERDQATVNFETGVVDLTDGTVLPLTKIGCEPPPYNTLWPTGPACGGTFIGVSVMLLARVMKAFKEAGGDTTVRALIRGPSDGIYWTSETVPEFQALLMPATVAPPTGASRPGEQS